MALSDAKRLYDITTRQQAYIEGFKLSTSQALDEDLLKVSDELKVIFSRIKYATLDGMSKAEFLKLVTTVRLMQTRIYSRYSDRLLKQLRDFMTANVEVSMRTYVSAFKEQQTEEVETGSVWLPTFSQAFAYVQKNKPDDSRAMYGIAAISGTGAGLWSNITNAPLPATGSLLLPFVAAFVTSSKVGVENTIRKAYANGLTVSETIEELTKQNKQGTSSQIERARKNSVTTITTAIQHVAAISGAAVASIFWKRYIWLSVMDNVTSEICKSRNQRVYEYGNGPLPPAHPRCRSHTAPIVGSDEFGAETFTAWVSRQPKNVRDDLLTKDGNAKAISLVEYKRKAEIILSR